ncbi:hypothetical protein AX17_007498 [Amanita inopinata Kibby_2008]|nr:hypothetical protein AX17_007498 [Amanita inopinata Kibby_2008]
MRLFAFTSSVALGAAIHAARAAVLNHVSRQLSATTACQNLQSKLGTTIVQYNGTAEYYNTTQTPWNFANVDVDPTCIVYPRETAHVSAAMAEIYNAGSHYAVQAGSHTAMKNWNVVQDGVLIMFSHMANASYDTTTKTITIQPGIPWEGAIVATESYGVAPLGGRVRDVGTGLLLGGGVSFLSPQYGWASSMFKELDVVLVTGEVVTAKADNEYSDLFWALKGCASRCGIVTRYEVYPALTGTKNDKNYYGGTIRYPASSSKQIVSAVGEFNKATQDPKAIILTLFYYNTNADGTTSEYTDLYLFYRGSKLPPNIFGTLLSIPSTSQTLGPLSYYDMVTFIPKFPKGQIEFFGATALAREENTLQNTYANWRNFSQALSSELSINYLAYTPVLDPMLEASRAMGGDPMNAVLGGFITVNFATSLPVGVTTVSTKFTDARQLLFKQCPPSPGLPLYIGESDVSQNAYATYNNYTELKNVYMKYDPTRFNVDHMDGPIGL